MPQWCDREGTFRAFPIEWAIQNARDSQAVAFAAVFNLNSLWNGEDWEDWTPYEMQASGSFWLVKKDGKINENGCRALAAAIGWDGDWEKLVNTDWTQQGVQIVVKPDTYQGQTKFKAAFINAWDAEPRGGLRSAPPEEVNRLKQQFGGQMRALLGGAAKAPAKPAGKPPVPPPASNGRPGPVVHTTASDDIPFEDSLAM